MKSSKRERRGEGERKLAPPSRGSRAVTISGADSLRISVLTASREWKRPSKRSSKRSGGFRVRRARRKSASEKITPTTRGAIDRFMGDYVGGSGVRRTW